MLRKFLSTTASRLIIAVINLGIVWISARFLGAEILGTISLIVLGISIIQLITAVFAGSSLVYQVSRHSLAELLLTAWIWIVISSLPVLTILHFLSLIPAGYSKDVFFLSLLGSIITVNQNIFLGRERVNLFNTMSILQVLLVIIPLFYFVAVSKWINTEAYITSQYISMGVCSIIGLAINFPPLKEFRFPESSVIKESFRFGGYLQAASIMQLFNYRLSYYLIEKFFDRATLGIFSLGVQIAESLWIISKSMAILLYSRLSNNTDKEYSINLTVNFIKATTIITSAILIILLFLPDKFFVFIFQKEFSNITIVIATLSAGILSMAISLMYSHYYSGTGIPIHNTISSGIGLLLTIITGLILIPEFGLLGAGLTSSISYFGSMVYQAVVFTRITGIEVKNYIPVKSDLERIMLEIRKLV